MLLSILFTEMCCCCNKCCKPLKSRLKQELTKANCFAIRALKKALEKFFVAIIFK